MNYHHSYACFPYFLFSQLFSPFNNQRAHQFLTLMIFIQHMSFFPPKQTDEQEVITFLLTTEIIPLCLRIMEAGSELSKTVSVVTARFLLPSGSPSQQLPFVSVPFRLLALAGSSKVGIQGQEPQVLAECPTFLLPCEFQCKGCFVLLFCCL